MSANFYDMISALKTSFQAVSNKWLEVHNLESEVKAEVNRRLEEERKRLVEAIDSGRTAALREERGRLQKQAIKSVKEEILAIAKRAVAGEFPDAPLGVANGVVGRIIEIIPTLDQWGTPQPFSARDCVVAEEVLEEGFSFFSASNQDFHTIKVRALVVPVTDPNEDGLVELARKLLVGGSQVSWIREVMPKGFVLSFHTGETIPLGSCSHHSGEIEAFGLILPTGRMAVGVSFSGDHGARFRSIIGTASDPSWYPELSAKHREVRNSDELTSLTPEEVRFVEELGKVGENRPWVIETPELEDGPRLLEQE